MRSAYGSHKADKNECNECDLAAAELRCKGAFGGRSSDCNIIVPRVRRVSSTSSRRREDIIESK